jgi:hypothetical protein
MTSLALRLLLAVSVTLGGLAMAGLARPPALLQQLAP